MAEAQQRPIMSDGQFRMFARIMRETCGLRFGPDTRFLLEKRIERRMRALQLDSFPAYHYQLRNGSSGADELALLIDDLTTNETYFFRGAQQLRALVEHIVPELLLRRRDGDSRVAIWSAGCSSGEEPYSAAMLALEAGLDMQRLCFYASDISQRMLRRARQGAYRNSAFRETEEAMRQKYFVEKEGLWHIADAVKRHVTFTRLNLLDRTKIALFGRLDVILCRNVIIYLDPEARLQLVQTFWDVLRPGGHLLLGHSESLLNLSTSFELRHVGRELVYRRPPPGAALDAWQIEAPPPVDSEPQGASE